MVRTVTGQGGGSVTVVTGVTPEDLATALEEYATDAEVATALEPYATDADVATALEPYVTDADVTTALEPYVTEADVATELEAYVTDADLTTALIPYATTALVATALEPYATDADMTSAMANKQPLHATLTSLAQIEPKIPWFLTVRDTPLTVGRVYPPPGVQSGTSPFAVTGKNYGNYTYTVAANSTVNSSFSFTRCFTQLPVNRDPNGTTWLTQAGRYNADTGAYLGPTVNTLTDGSVYTGDFGDIAFGQYMLFQRIRFTHYSVGTRPKRIVLVAGSRPAPALAFELIADITCTYDVNGYCDVAIPMQGRLFNNMRMIVPAIEGAGPGGTEAFCGVCSLTWLAAEPNQINGSTVFSGTQHHFESVPTVGPDSIRLATQTSAGTDATVLWPLTSGDSTNPQLVGGPQHKFIKTFTSTGGRQLWMASLITAALNNDLDDYWNYAAAFKVNSVIMHNALLPFDGPNVYRRMNFTWTTTLPAGLHTFTFEWENIDNSSNPLKFYGDSKCWFEAMYVQLGSG